MYVADLGAINHHIMPCYQLATAPAQLAAMVPTAGGLRADKLEVCPYLCISSKNQIFNILEILLQIV